jgi:GTP-binding protein LepA
VERIPSPKGNPDGELQALIFDSVFNSFRGIIAYFKVLNGEIRKGDRVKFVATNKDYIAEEVGTLKLTQKPKDVIKTGDVGYIISGIKEAREVKVGETNQVRSQLKVLKRLNQWFLQVFIQLIPMSTKSFEKVCTSCSLMMLQLCLSPNHRLP